MEAASFFDAERSRSIKKDIADSPARAAGEANARATPKYYNLPFDSS